MILFINIKQKDLYNLLIKIPKNRITTYKILAKKLRTSPRAIGKMLNANKYPEKYPCYKVVMNDGRIGGYSSSIKEKIKLLRKDGIEVRNGKIEKFRQITCNKE